MKKILLVIFMIFFSFTMAHADIDLVLFNTSKNTKHYFIHWLNHPFGCTEVNLGITTVIKCDHPFAVGELKPGATNTVTLKGGYLVDTNEFMVLWIDALSYPENPEDDQYIKFSPKTQPTKIYLSPATIVKSYQ